MDSLDALIYSRRDLETIIDKLLLRQATYDNMVDIDPDPTWQMHFAHRAAELTLVLESLRNMMDNPGG